MPVRCFGQCILSSGSPVLLIGLLGGAAGGEAQPSAFDPETTVLDENRHVTTRNELPDISAPLEILSEDLRAGAQPKAAPLQLALAEVYIEWAPLTWDTDLAGAIEKLELAAAVSASIMVPCSMRVTPNSTQRRIALAGWQCAVA